MKVTLKDGSVKEYDKSMSVYDIALDLSEGLARAACAGEIDGEVVDIRLLDLVVLHREPLNTKVRLLIVHIFEQIGVSGENDGPFPDLSAADLLQHLVGAVEIVLLEFDEELQFRRGFREEEIEELFQRGDLCPAELFPLPGTEIERLQFRQRMVVDHSGAVAAPFQRVVVSDDQFPVAGGMDIEFNGVDPQRDCLAESFQRIFRIERAAPPMCHNLKTAYHCFESPVLYQQDTRKIRIFQSIWRKKSEKKFK